MNLDSVVFQVTTRCPFNCPQCYMQKGSSDLPFIIGKDLIDILKNNGGRVVQFTGGEPALYQRLPELIEYASINKLVTAVATSGLNHSFEFYKRLMEAGLDVLCVSINDIEEKKNSLTRETYAEGFSAIKDAKSAGLYCCANIVVTDQNIDNLDALSQYLLSIGVDSLALLRPVQSYDGKYVPTISSATLQTIKSLSDTNPSRICVESCFKEYWEYKNKSCFKCQECGTATIFVNADGTISPCSQMTQYRYSSLETMYKNQETWKGGCC